MRFKIDENLPAEIGTSLGALGHTADTVDEEGLAGSPDSVLVGAAAADQRIRLTLDKEIASTRRYPTATHCGVVLFRPGSVGRGAVLAFVQEHLPTLLSLKIENRVTVVSHTGIRMR